MDFNNGLLYNIIKPWTEVYCSVTVSLKIDSYVILFGFSLQIFYTRRGKYNFHTLKEYAFDKRT